MAASILAASCGIFPLTAYSIFFTKGLIVFKVSLNLFLLPPPLPASLGVTVDIMLPSGSKLREVVVGKAPLHRES